MEVYSREEQDVSHQVVICSTTRHVVLYEAQHTDLAPSLQAGNMAAVISVCSMIKAEDHVTARPS